MGVRAGYSEKWPQCFGHDATKPITNISAAFLQERKHTWDNGPSGGNRRVMSVKGGNVETIQLGEMQHGQAQTKSGE